MWNSGIAGVFGGKKWNLVEGIGTKWNRQGSRERSRFCSENGSGIWCKMRNYGRFVMENSGKERKIRARMVLLDGKL